MNGEKNESLLPLSSDNCGVETTTKYTVLETKLPILVDLINFGLFLQTHWMFCLIFSFLTKIGEFGQIFLDAF